MGVSYRAYVIAGAQVELRSKQVPVTKYNENTGEPYEVEEETEGWYLGEAEVPGVENEEVARGLEVFYSDYEDAHRYVGIKCAEADDETMAAELGDFDTARKRCSRLLKEHYGYDEGARLYLILYVSY